MNDTEQKILVAIDTLESKIDKLGRKHRRLVRILAEIVNSWDEVEGYDDMDKLIEKARKILK